jgi:hypothetical protein
LEYEYYESIIDLVANDYYSGHKRREPIEYLTPHLTRFLRSRR